MVNKPGLQPLSVADHTRSVAGFVYVYPVVSRRAGGVSVGINLNTNQACNWRCVYCQVPGLVRGNGVRVDISRIESELRELLGQILHGNFMEERVPEGLRDFRDIAFSGDGEPTGSPDFPAVVSRVGAVMADAGLVGKIRLVLITNGSQMWRKPVQTALAAMAGLGGEVWFKLDRVTPAGLARINQTRMSVARQRENLRTAASLCPTWAHTCLFALDGQPPSAEEMRAYLSLLEEAREWGLRGVALYDVARLSHQPEAGRISRLPDAWVERCAEDIRALGLPVSVSVSRDGAAS